MSELTDLLLQLFNPLEALLAMTIVVGGGFAVRIIIAKIEDVEENLEDRVDEVRDRVRRLEDAHIPTEPYGPPGDD